MANKMMHFYAFTCSIDVIYFVPGKLNVSIVIDFSISVNIIEYWFSVNQRLTKINRYQQLAKYYLPDAIYIVCDNNLPQDSTN